MSEQGEIITSSGLYTAPDGTVYSVEFRDVHETCPDGEHEHDLRCYQAADGGPPLVPDAVKDVDWAEGSGSGS